MLGICDCVRIDPEALPQVHMIAPLVIVGDIISADCDCSTAGVLSAEIPLKVSFPTFTIILPLDSTPTFKGVSDGV